MSLGRQCRSREGGEQRGHTDREQTFETCQQVVGLAQVLAWIVVTAFLPTECQPLTPVNTLDGA